MPTWISIHLQKTGSGMIGMAACNDNLSLKCVIMSLHFNGINAALHYCSLV